MIRDEEIKRLVSYAKGLGLKVCFVPKGTCAAEWHLDNTQITIFKNNNTSKIETILSLIHELGHAKHNLWEKGRTIDTKVEDALDHIEESEEHEDRSDKDQRKVILDNELAGTKYWWSIYKDTNMKFPVWKMKIAMEQDIWVYREFHKTGIWPDKAARNEACKEIKERYRKENE